MQRNGLTKSAVHRKSAEEKLLLAARRLFCRAGIHATGISQILEEAGVARRSLYKHYGSKENLLKAVLDTEANMWFHWFDLDLPGLKCSNKIASSPCLACWRTGSRRKTSSVVYSLMLWRTVKRIVPG